MGLIIEDHYLSTKSTNSDGILFETIYCEFIDIYLIMVGDEKKLFIHNEAQEAKHQTSLPSRACKSNVKSLDEREKFYYPYMTAINSVNRIFVKWRRPDSSYN